MRKEIHDLTDAVRALQIEATGRPAPHCVRIGIPKETLPEKLLALKGALDAVDASGALVSSVASEAGTADELAKFKNATEQLLRYQRMRGLDPQEGEEIVRTALGMAGKRKARLEPLPVFAPNGWKRRKKFRPGLRHLPDHDDRGRDLKASINEHVGKMNWIMTSMGQAAPTEVMGPRASRAEMP